MEHAGVYVRGAVLTGGGVSLAWGSDMFKGKSAFVTGGGTGNGVPCGGGILGRTTRGLAAPAEGLGERAKWVQCDVTSNESVGEAIATAVERSGPLGLAVSVPGDGRQHSGYAP